MHIMLAPDSFKGSLSAVQAANIMEEAVCRVQKGTTVEKVPLADGGEGTVAALTTAAGGRIVPVPAKDPLGRDIMSFIGILADGATAVIELAAASGLPLLTEKEKQPLTACTYGTGQLIKAALDHGCRKLIIGIGGSATNDGGSGLARALGVKFLDENACELPPGGAALSRLRSIDLSGLDARLKQAEIIVASDVTNPLSGPQGASAVYGPQKGAGAKEIKILDQALAHYAAVVEDSLHLSIRDVPGAGAAGGAGAGLLAFCQGTIRPGIDIVLDTARFAEKLKTCNLVFTAEGRIDQQTAYGKAPVGVARQAKKLGLPVIAFAGILGPGYQEVYAQGIDAVIANVQQLCDSKTALDNAIPWLSESVERVMRLINVGHHLK